MNEFRTHRFDCDPVDGVKYYMNDKLMHTDNHNLPKAGGSLQLKLWADGNKWWSGTPSKTDVHMRVKSIIAYYNTTSSLNNLKWDKRCEREKTQCVAVTSVKPVSPSNPVGGISLDGDNNGTSADQNPVAGGDRSSRPKVSSGSKVTAVAGVGLIVSALALVSLT